MSCGRDKRACAGSMRHRVSVIRRQMSAPVFGSAEPVYSRTVALTTRAKIETKSGTTEFNRVVIGDQTVTHVITIRHTKTSIDSRDQVSDASGNLYSILKVENPNEANDELRLYCARSGEVQRKAVQ